jgi:hypothetical protein
MKKNNFYEGKKAVLYLLDFKMNIIIKEQIYIFFRYWNDITNLIIYKIIVLVPN